MANIEGVHAALREWIQTIDPSAKVALLLTAGEIAILHLWLESMQEAIEQSQFSGGDFEVFAMIRKKVEDLLVQAGYGGDLRPCCPTPSSSGAELRSSATPS